MAYKQRSPQAVVEGGSGAATLTGVLTGNGTSAFTVSTVTDNTVIMGSTSNLVQNTTIKVTDNGEMTNASQPAFSGYLNAAASNVTGDGTSAYLGDSDISAGLTEITDQNADFVPSASGGAVFTAPVTGQYYITMSTGNDGLTSGMTALSNRIDSSNRGYRGTEGDAFSIGNSSNALTMGYGVLVDMDAADTVKAFNVISNGTKVAGFTAPQGGYIKTYFMGHLIC